MHLMVLTINLLLFSLSFSPVESLVAEDKNGDANVFSSNDQSPAEEDDGESLPNNEKLVPTGFASDRNLADELSRNIMLLKLLKERGKREEREAFHKLVAELSGVDRSGFREAMGSSRRDAEAFGLALTGLETMPVVAPVRTQVVAPVRTPVVAPVRTPEAIVLAATPVSVSFLPGDLNGVSQAETLPSQSVAYVMANPKLGSTLESASYFAPTTTAYVLVPAATATTVNFLSRSSLPSIMASPFNSISASPFNSISASPFNTISASPFNSISASPFNSISASPFNSISASPFNSISASPFNSISASPFNSISASPLNSILASPFNSISTSPFNSISTSPFNSISASPLNSILASPFQSVSASPQSSSNYLRGRGFSPNTGVRSVPIN